MCRSPAMMRGYWRDPELTASVIDADGWLHTGDLGRLDADGNLTIAGRRKEMYIRGGYNVYPTEVEAALTGHPWITRTAVVGVPDPVLGEIGVAFVVLADDAPVDRDDADRGPGGRPYVVPGADRGLQGTRPRRGRRRAPAHRGGQARQAGTRGAVGRRAPWGAHDEEGGMKELIYHRLLLPAVERTPTRWRSSTATTASTYAGARRPACRLAQRAAAPARDRARRPVRGDGAEQPPVPRAVPRRVPRRRRDQPAQPAAGAEGARVHPRRLGHEGRASSTRSSRRVIDQVRDDVGIEQVVLIGDGDVPHDVDYEDLARARRRRRCPTSPTRTTPSSSCTPAAPPDCPRACCSTSAPRCSTCTTSPWPWRFDERRRVPAPDADVPRRVDGRHPRRPGARRRVGVRPAVRPGRGARR